MLICFGSLSYAEELQFEHVMNIGARGGGDGQFKYVEDFAFDKNGNLLVTDAANSTIQVFNKTTGEFISKFGGKGDGDGNFEKPEGIAVAPDGAIFVAECQQFDGPRDRHPSRLIH